MCIACSVESRWLCTHTYGQGCAASAQTGDYCQLVKVDGSCTPFMYGEGALDSLVRAFVKVVAVDGGVSVSFHNDAECAEMFPSEITAEYDGSQHTVTIGNEFGEGEGLSFVSAVGDCTAFGLDVTVDDVTLQGVVAALDLRRDFSVHESCQVASGVNEASCGNGGEH